MTEAFWCFAILAFLTWLRDMHRYRETERQNQFERQRELTAMQQDWAEARREEVPADEDDPDWWRKSAPGNN